MYRSLKVMCFAVIFALMFAGIAAAHTIYQVQYATNQGSGDDCFPSSFNAQSVTLQGVVTAVQAGTYPDYYIQNPDSTSWNGVSIFDTSTDPQVGDLVSLTGTVQEYFGLTEIINLTSHQIISHNNALPETLLISTADLAGGCGPNAEKYEGVLIRVENITVMTNPNSYGEFMVQDASGVQCMVDDNLYLYGNNPPVPAPSQGMTYAKLIGVVTYSYSDYRIMPRSGNDFVVSGANPPHVMYSFPLDGTHLQVQFNMNVEQSTSEDPENYEISDGVTISQAVRNSTDHSIVDLTTSAQTNGFQYTLTVNNVENEDGDPMTTPDVSTFRGGFTPIAVVQQPVSAENDSSRLVGELVTLKAVVTTDTVDYIASYFYVQDNSFTHYNGVQIFNTDFENPQRGDTLLITGTVDEYFGETEVTDILRYVVAGHGPGVTPRTVDPSDLTQDSDHAEWYEGVLVRLDAVKVCQLPDDYEQWKVCSLNDQDTVSVGYHPDYNPVLDQIISIAGVLRYRYDEYVLWPRFGDISMTDVDEEDGNLPVQFSVFQNYPNPFNASTGIAYSVPQKANVNLSVFNILGEQISSYPQGNKMPGNYTIRIDMSQFPSGIYFYRLEAGNFTNVKKMVLLK